jgi:hypothetical protein
VPLGQVLEQLQRVVINFDVLGFATGTVMNLGLLISLFNHQPTRNKKHRRYDHMKNTMPLRVRISRFLEERHVYRARPHFLPELALFGLIVILAVWPMFSLAAALETMR